VRIVLQYINVEISTHMHNNFLFYTTKDIFEGFKKPVSLASGVLCMQLTM